MDNWKPSWVLFVNLSRESWKTIKMMGIPLRPCFSGAFAVNFWVRDQ